MLLLNLHQEKVHQKLFHLHAWQNIEPEQFIRNLNIQLYLNLKQFDILIQFLPKLRGALLAENSLLDQYVI
jgi:hypothetical protein